MKNPYRTRAGTIALLAVCLGVALPASVSAQVSVRGELTHELELQPGGRHSGTIILENTSARAAEVKLYQTDYRSEAPGRHFYEDPGTNPRSNASWISISPRRFSVPAGESYTVSYIIDVPADESLSGSYWSIFMIEPIPPESPESADADPDQTAVGLTTVIRYGFKFLTHIGTTGTVQPEILDASLTLEGEVPTLGVDIRNAGTRALAVEIWAELYDGAGGFVLRQDGIAGSLYPESSRRYKIPLSDVSRGEFTALVVIDAGDNNVFGATFPIALE